MKERTGMLRGKMRGVFRALAPILLLLVCCTACGGNVLNTENAKEQGSEEPALSLPYDAPRSVPSILVDQSGYRTGAEKMIILRGETLPETFEIRRLEDDEVVFQGSIRGEREDAALKERDSYGYFTDFQTEGSYYIRADIVGSSYAFPIGANVGRRLFAESCLVYHKNRRNTGGWAMTAAGGDAYLAESCETLRTLLLACELNEEKFTDALGVEDSGNGIPDLLDEARYEIDYLRSLQNQTNGAVSETDPGINAAYAAVLAKFSHLYAAYDEDYAETCISDAERAWEYFSGKADASTEQRAFFAAAELYRISGDRKYENVLSAFFGRESFSEEFQTDEEMFFGGVTYLLTVQPINTNVCETIMDALLTQAERIADAASSSAYLVTSVSDTLSADAVSVQTMLKDMRRLTVTDHIIYNHEYTTIIENHVHYLLGRNPQAVNLADAEAEYSYQAAETEGFADRPAENAQLLLMLSMIL